jgi:hypothetical protein
MKEKNPSKVEKTPLLKKYQLFQHTLCLRDQPRTSHHKQSGTSRSGTTPSTNKLLAAATLDRITHGAYQVVLDG